MPDENSQQNTTAQINSNRAEVQNSLPVNNPSPPEQVLSQSDTNPRIKNILAVIIGIIIMVGGIMAGVYLVNRQQDIREKAAEDLCTSSPDNCILIQDPENSGSYKVEGIVYSVFLTDTQVRAFDLSVTQDGCYQVLNQGDTIYWNRIGTSSECNDLVSIQVWLTKLPSQTNPPVQSQCLGIKVYDTDWNLLTSTQINRLSQGDIVRIAAEGTTTQGQIDQAKFSVNGTERSPVSTKKPGTNEFFDEYVIPAGTDQFSVNVQFHHSQFGWF